MKLIFKNNKTMKKILIIICVIFFNMPALLNLFNLTGYNLCSAQKVTSTAGKHFYGSDGSLNWTIGEPIIKTHYGTTNILSQGFHQTFPEIAACNLDLTISTTNANCGNADGNASVNVSGGTPPWSYQWTSGDTLSTADSLAAGIYIATVTDSTGCSDFIAVTISDNDGPAITETVTDVSCNGSSNGAIDISVSGGTTPYTYYWSNGSTSNNISNLRGELTIINLVWLNHIIFRDFFERIIQSNRIGMQCTECYIPYQSVLKLMKSALPQIGFGNQCITIYVEAPPDRSVLFICQFVKPIIISFR